MTADSPFFEPQQFYVIGFLQDSWRVGDRLTLELGLRYDYYSVVKEANDQARPFFVEENDFGNVGDGFYDADKNNFSPRLSAAYQLSDRTVVRGGFGLFYGPGQFEDRIQPIENYIDRSRVQASDVPANALQYPVDPATIQNLLSIRGYTHDYPNEYNMQYGASVSHELPGAVNLTVGYTGSQGYDMFLRGVGNVLDPVTLRAPGAELRPDRLQDRGLRRRRRPRRHLPDGRLRPRQLRRAADQRHAPLPRRLHRRAPVPGTRGTRARRRARTKPRRRRTRSTSRPNTAPIPQDIPHTFNGSLVYLVPGEGFWTGGWRVGGIVNARSGVPLNVTIARPDNVTVNGVNVANIPGGNSRGTQRPDLVPGVDPYINQDGVRWLNPAAFTTPQPGTFGNLPRNYLRGPVVRAVRPDVQQGLPVAASQGFQFRLEMFNLLNRLNYENPATSLPNGTPGVPFTDAQAGTFGYMLGPLNRTVGLGTARQTQLSLRYTF